MDTMKLCFSETRTSTLSIKSDRRSREVVPKKKVEIEVEKIMKFGFSKVYDFAI